jgi:predicted RNase H-like HicB family nuclease
MYRTYRVIIEPDTRGYHGYVPALRGCHTWGRNVTETKAHLQEAIELYVESLLAHDEEVPEEQSLESFETVELRRRTRAHRMRRRQYA